MSPLNKDNFTSFYSIWLLSISFSCVTVLALVPSIILIIVMRTDILDSFWLLLTDKGGKFVLCLLPPVLLWWQNWSATSYSCLGGEDPLSSPAETTLVGNKEGQLSLLHCFAALFTYLGWWCSFFLVFGSSRIGIVKKVTCYGRDTFPQFFGFS